MRTRIISFLLAALFIVSSMVFTSCKDEKPSPLPIDTSNNGDTVNADTQTPAETSAPVEEETEPNGLLKKYFSAFVPDDNALYRGKIGLAAESSGVSFDKLAVKAPDKNDIYATDYEADDALNLDIFTADDASLWSVGEDGIDENKSLNFSGTSESRIFMGNPEWGPYRINVSVKLAEVGDVAKILFCVADESNYYSLNIGVEDNTMLTLTKVTGGNEEIVDQIGLPVATGAWITSSVSLTYTGITCYVAGQEVFRVTDEVSDETLITGKFGMGQWSTQFYIDNIVIEDIATGDVIYSQDFENASDFIAGSAFGIRNGGSWATSANAAEEWVIIEEPDSDGNHVLAYTGATSNSGAMIIFPDIDIPEECSAYRVKFIGYRTAGTGEGWSLIWGYSSDTNYVDYNFGGWTGCGGYQVIVNGSKTNHNMSNTIGQVSNEWQTSAVEVYRDRVLAYYNDKLIQLLWID